MSAIGLGCMGMTHGYVLRQLRRLARIASTTHDIGVVTDSEILVPSTFDPRGSRGGSPK
jgi:hypothetical protein